MAQDKISAKDYKCCICGKQAEVFWPVFDPDIPSNPYCKECLEKERIRMILELERNN